MYLRSTSRWYPQDEATRSVLIHVVACWIHRVTSNHVWLHREAHLWKHTHHIWHLTWLHTCSTSWLVSTWLTSSCCLVVCHHKLRLDKLLLKHLDLLLLPKHDLLVGKSLLFRSQLRHVRVGALTRHRWLSCTHHVWRHAHHHRIGTHLSHNISRHLWGTDRSWSLLL